MGNSIPNIRQTNIQNGTNLQRPITSGLMTAPTSIVRLNQPQTTQNQAQFVSQTLWTNNTSQSTQQSFNVQKPIQTSVKNGKKKLNILSTNILC